MLRAKASEQGKSWIVKLGARRGVFDPRDPKHSQPFGFFFEWAGYAFVSTLDGNPLCLRFLGGDWETGVLVLEDLGPDLADLLMGSDPAEAETGLLALAHALGRLHARAAGREDEFRRIWQELAHGPPPSQAALVIDHGTRALRQIAGDLDLLIILALEDDLATIASSPARQPLHSFWHGDPCPDNFLPAGTGRLMDFQSGGFGPVLLDGVYARMSLPSCWCAGELSPDVVGKFEDAYREELVIGIPAAGDEAVFGRALVEACACWFLLQIVHMSEILHNPDQGTPKWFRGFAVRAKRDLALPRAEALAAIRQQLGHLPT